MPTPGCSAAPATEADTGGDRVVDDPYRAGEREREEVSRREWVDDANDREHRR